VRRSNRRISARAALATVALPFAAAGLIWIRHVRGRRRPGYPYFAGAPLLIAHRGGSALAPENTLVAFDRAVRWWNADILELDVQPTRDGEVVVVHDPTLDRTTDGTGLVADHDLATIQSLDAGWNFTPDGGSTYPFRGRGVHVPTLYEVLSAHPHTRVNIEIKDGRAQDRVWESVVEANAVDRVLIAGHKVASRNRISGQPVPVSASADEIRLMVAQLRLGAVPFPPAVDAFQVPDRWEGRVVATRELVEAAHARNMAVHVWTVDDPREMVALLEIGVDGIISDRPDRLARVLNERCGRPLPPGPPDPLPEPFLHQLLQE
jgi:glycerophosphoryl diester phosphodiesterase